MGMTQVTVVDHPLVIDGMAHLRDKTTDTRKFRYYSDKVCQLLFAEAIRGLSFRDEEVMTPCGKARVEKLADEIVVVPVLRAGVAMLAGATWLLPKVKVGFVGMERDEKTAEAREYYWKMPQITKQSVVMVTDPMLATGGSLLHLLRQVSQHGPKLIKAVAVVAAPEGLSLIHQEFPQLEVVTAAVDEKLNSKKYIVPGIGDYGDRYFGTEELVDGE